MDELSCARLIGMNLALMSELAEVDDSNEPVLLCQHLYLCAFECQPFSFWEAGVSSGK